MRILTCLAKGNNLPRRQGGLNIQITITKLLDYLLGFHLRNQ